MTLNEIIEIFRDISNRHYQIFDFAAVQDFNIDADKAPKYPILVVNPTPATLPKTDSGYKSLIMSLDLQVIDLVSKDNSNEIEVLSDTMQIINDVVNELTNHPDYINDGLDIVSDITLEPLRGVYDSDVDGWKISIEIEQPNKRTYCTAPIISK